MLLPQPLAQQSSLTHIQNLVHAVEICIENKPRKTTFFNVSDSDTYSLNQIFKSIAKHKNPKIIIVPIPISVLVMVSNLIQRIRVKSMFTPQAIAYLKNASVLNTKSIREQLNYNPKKVFNVGEIGL